MQRSKLLGIDLMAALERAKPHSSFANATHAADEAETEETQPRRSGGRRVFSDRSSVLKVSGRIVYV